MSKAEELRKLFVRDSIIKVAGAHDGLSAKLTGEAGFDAVWASGLEISASYAVPDANILTMSQYLERACQMNDAVSLPVIADCDTGFGNSNNVIHMVKKYEAAGIAGVCIEDKHFPKVNSLVAGRQELAPIAEFVGKILAAKNAQADPDFMVIARVEALIAGWGIEEALKRADAYCDAGADAILIHSKSKSPDEIFEFARRWNNKAPLVVVPTIYFSVTAQELEKRGVKMVIYANQGIRSAIRAMKDTFKQIYDSGSSLVAENKIASLKEVFELQGMPKMQQDELMYLRAETDKPVAVIPAAGDHLEEYSMKDISADIPIAMLDINGKPLLQRQVEVLNRSGIYNIHVIGGYKKEKIAVDGINLVENPDYKTTGILYSLMCALQRISGRAFICYGDVLFDHIILKRLLERNEDIALLVDSTYDSKGYGPEKRVDLVISDAQLPKTKRILHKDTLSLVRRIGKEVVPDAAAYEFTGMALFSKKGLIVFKEAYEQSLKRYKNKPFHSAQDFKKSGLGDLLQEIIDLGHPVHCLEVNAGWLEIHSLDNYKLACSIVK